MIEKTSMHHPDKIADRIAGAIVDLAYKTEENPRIAVEVLIGHGKCTIIIESSLIFTKAQIQPIVDRIAGEGITVSLKSVRQDSHLAAIQEERPHAADNGIFKGVPLTEEERAISKITREIEEKAPYDGKYILDGNTLVICQSNLGENDERTLQEYYEDQGYEVCINPVGSWTGGIDVDTGATNRKLGSDMASSVTGGGVNGKDLSKMDVSANIYAFYKAQELGKPVEMWCSIGSSYLNCKIGKKVTCIAVKDVIDYARDVINGMGGFEAFSEYGLY